MKVYIVMRNYANGVDAWDTIESVFLKQEDAEFCVLSLEENETDSSVSYYWDEWEVL